MQSSSKEVKLFYMGRGNRKISQSGDGSRTKQKTKSLIPQGHRYMEEGFNVLLVGAHGTGKTESVVQMADELGLKLKIFNCATLDPYTDLIGVPVPSQNDDGSDELRMVRPRIIDEADIIFFDELNRARPEVQNAVFEIIQFGSLNGEELPNLRCCWSAMNPPDGEYLVEDVDPALLDRFDAYHVLKPKVSVPYMSQHMDKSTALALREWWEGHNREKRGPESYISPRRLTKLGVLFEKIGSRAVKQALPLGGEYDSGKLLALLKAAKRGDLQKELENQKDNDLRAGGAGLTKALATRASIAKNSDGIKEYLQNNPNDLETQQKIVTLLSSSVGTKRLLKEFPDVIEALPKSQIEALLSGMKWSKKRQISNILYNQRFGSLKLIDLSQYPNFKEAMQNCSINTYGA